MYADFVPTNMAYAIQPWNHFSALVAFTLSFFHTHTWLPPVALMFALCHVLHQWVSLSAGTSLVLAEPKMHRAALFTPDLPIREIILCFFTAGFARVILQVLSGPQQCSSQAPACNGQCRPKSHFPVRYCDYSLIGAKEVEDPEMGRIGRQGKYKFDDLSCPYVYHNFLISIFSISSRIQLLPVPSL